MNRRVLIIETYGLVREALKLLFTEHADCNVVAQVSSITQAVSQMEHVEADVAVIDQNVIAQEGLEAINLLLERDPDIKIMLAISQHDAKHMRAYLEADVMGVLAYQGSPGDLRFAIDSVCRGERFISPYAAKFLVNGFVRREADREGGTRHRRVAFTPRQRDVLRGLAQGKANKEIADELNISVKTVETHRARLMKTLDLSNANQLLKFAIRRGFDVTH